MAYPERKLIYETYESLVKKIVAEKKYEIYAEGAIDEFDSALLAAFKTIRMKLLKSKEWLPE